MADVLLRKPDGQVAHDFQGKLAYAWPRTAVQRAGDLFSLGYGLTYADRSSVPALPEVSGITGEQIPIGNYLERGKAVHGYRVSLVGADGVPAAGDVSTASSADGALRMTALDYKAQEDARRFTWNKPGAALAIQAQAPMDLDRQTNGDVLLVTTVRVDALPADAWIGMGCGEGCMGRVSLRKPLASLGTGRWTSVGVPLKCLRAAGADMHRIDRPFVMTADANATVAVSRVALGTDADVIADCAK